MVRIIKSVCVLVCALAFASAQNNIKPIADHGTSTTAANPSANPLTLKGNEAPSVDQKIEAVQAVEKFVQDRSLISTVPDDTWTPMGFTGEGLSWNPFEGLTSPSKQSTYSINELSVTRLPQQLVQQQQEHSLQQQHNILGSTMSSLNAGYDILQPSLQQRHADIIRQAIHIERIRRAALRHGSALEKEAQINNGFRDTNRPPRPPGVDDIEVHRRRPPPQLPFRLHSDREDTKLQHEANVQLNEQQPQRSASRINLETSVTLRSHGEPMHTTLSHSLEMYDNASNMAAAEDHIAKTSVPIADIIYQNIPRSPKTELHHTDSKRPAKVEEIAGKATSRFSHFIPPRTMPQPMLNIVWSKSSKPEETSKASSRRFSDHIDRKQDLKSNQIFTIDSKPIQQPSVNVTDNILKSVISQPVDASDYLSNRVSNAPAITSYKKEIVMILESSSVSPAQRQNNLAAMTDISLDALIGTDLMGQDRNHNVSDHSHSHEHIYNWQDHAHISGGQGWDHEPRFPDSLIKAGFADTANPTKTSNRNDLIYAINEVATFEKRQAAANISSGAMSNQSLTDKPHMHSENSSYNFENANIHLHENKTAPSSPLLSAADMYPETAPKFDDSSKQRPEAHDEINNHNKGVTPVAMGTVEPVRPVSVHLNADSRKERTQYNGQGGTMLSATMFASQFMTMFDEWYMQRFGMSANSLFGKIDPVTGARLNQEPSLTDITSIHTSNANTVPPFTTRTLDESETSTRAALLTQTPHFVRALEVPPLPQEYKSAQHQTHIQPLEIPQKDRKQHLEIKNNVQIKHTFLQNHQHVTEIAITPPSEMFKSSIVTTPSAVMTSQPTIKNMHQADTISSNKSEYIWMSLEGGDGNRHALFQDFIQMWKNHFPEAGQLDPSHGKYFISTHSTTETPVPLKFHATHSALATKSQLFSATVANKKHNKMVLTEDIKALDGLTETEISSAKVNNSGNETNGTEFEMFSTERNGTMREKTNASVPGISENERENAQNQFNITVQTKINGKLFESVSIEDSKLANHTLVPTTSSTTSETPTDPNEHIEVSLEGHIIETDRNTVADTAIKAVTSPTNKYTIGPNAITPDLNVSNSTITSLSTITELPSPTVDPDLLGDINEARLMQGLSMLAPHHVDIYGNVKPELMHTLGSKFHQSNIIHLNPGNSNTYNGDHGLNHRHALAHAEVGNLMTPELHSIIHRLLRIRQPLLTVSQPRSIAATHGYGLPQGPGQNPAMPLDPDMLADMAEAAYANRMGYGSYNGYIAGRK